MHSRRLFTVDQYEKLAATGIIEPDERVELIHGEILTMSPIGYLHIRCVNRLTHLFSKYADRVMVSIQNPILMSDSEPQPDVTLFRFDKDFYALGKPSDADALLVIEVADTTLDYDREVKRLLYAEALIAEYWIVNLVDDQLEVFRDPQAGDYHSTQILTATDEIEPLALSGILLAVSDML